MRHLIPNSVASLLSNPGGAGFTGMADDAFGEVTVSTTVKTYILYTSTSSDEGQESAHYVSTSVQTLSDHENESAHTSSSWITPSPWEQVPDQLANRLKFDEPGHPQLATVDVDEASDKSENSEGSETASNSSLGCVRNDSNPVPCKRMSECIAKQYESEDDADIVPGYARLPTLDNDPERNSYANGRVGNRSSSGFVMSSLKKRWKGMKKASLRGTSSAGKKMSSMSTLNFVSGRESETREDRHSRLGDEWINCIIPSWRKKRKTGRVRTLVFRGIPASVRGRVWQCAIGNPLNVSKDLFLVLKDRAAKGRAEYLRGRDTLALADGDLGGHGGRAEGLMESERSAHKAISLDLPRTFPELSFFHAEGSHYENALRDVLEAFLYLKPDVGYSQGMSFVAAVLLLYMDPYEAFSCFANMLLYKSCFLHFFRIKMPEVKCYLMVHERLLAEDMPALYNHFKQHGIESDLYMINWVMSLYCRALPLDLVTRIWDLYVLDGDLAIFRAALGLLRLFMPKLLKMKFEDMAYFLSHIPGDEIHPDNLLRSIRGVRVVTRRKFVDLFKDSCRNG